MSVILHGGPLAGKTYTPTTKEDRNGAILALVPTNTFPRRKASYIRRNYVAGHRIWQEWHFTGYKLGKRKK